MVELTDLKSIYDDFLTKGMEELAKLQKSTQMEDEHLSTAAANIIGSAMGNSIQALTALKNIELVNKDLLIKDQEELGARIKNGGLHYEYTYNDVGVILTKTLVNGTTKSIHELQADFVVVQIESEKANKDLRVQQKASLISEDGIKVTQSAKDMLIKDQQELAEKIKNGGMHYLYTYNLDGSLASKTLQNGATKSIYEWQSDKLSADVAFVKEQMKQLGYSVTYNNRIKVSEKYVETLGNLGLGGLSVPAAMWTTYFDMANDLYTNYGDIPAAKTFTTPEASAIVFPKAV